jgi:hypothetical protein
MMTIGLPRPARRKESNRRPRGRTSIDAILREAYRRHGRGRFISAALRHCLG